ncbi:MAG: TetR/AcrR family transcriptional regulator [Colwellia sp.]|nr:TetR/AcrR family transcriptional regulator [Colwellia sp.]
MITKNPKTLPTTALSTTKASTNYHHGDLYSSLLIAATELISAGGVESLSLRKLAMRIGVSRTAAYHHFTDKNDLLIAIATQGFVSWKNKAEQIFTDNSLTEREKYQAFVHYYVQFATENAAIYQLMFGGTLWKDKKSPSKLKEVAYPSFQFQLEMTNYWQEKGLLPTSANTLRLAQVTWATLHGIAQLVIDGIYADASQIDEMCQCAVDLFLVPDKK